MSNIEVICVQEENLTILKYLPIFIHGLFLFGKTS
jgi:hypothetical protein